MRMVMMAKVEGREGNLIMMTRMQVILSPFLLNSSLIACDEGDRNMFLSALSQILSANIHIVIFSHMLLESNFIMPSMLQK